MDAQTFRHNQDLPHGSVGAAGAAVAWRNDIDVISMSIT